MLKIVYLSNMATRIMMKSARWKFRLLGSDLAQARSKSWYIIMKRALWVPKNLMTLAMILVPKAITLSKMILPGQMFSRKFKLASLKESLRRKVLLLYRIRRQLLKKLLTMTQTSRLNLKPNLKRWRKSKSKQPISQVLLAKRKSSYQAESIP